MIGVYAGVSVKPKHIEEFLKIIEPLVTASRQDEGNVSYDFGAVSDTDFAFIERWESQELLEAARYPLCEGDPAASYISLRASTATSGVLRQPPPNQA